MTTSCAPISDKSRWHQRTTRRVVSHPVIFVLCTKLDIACDQQAMVVSWLLTTFGNSQKIILSSEVEGKLQRELHLFLEIFKFHICLINIIQLQESFAPDQKVWIEWRHDPGPYALARSKQEASKYLLFAHVKRTCSNTRNREIIVQVQKQQVLKVIWEKRVARQRIKRIANYWICTAL